MQFPLSDIEISSLALPKEFDLETLVRKILSRLGFKPRSKDLFLSGEVLENFCNYTLMKKGDFSTSDNDFLQISGSLNLFLKSDLLTELLSALKKSSQVKTNHSLFLHNSDVSHSESLLKLALEFFQEIYVINWLGVNSRIHAIPIGLENQSILMNGVQSDFLYLRNLGLPEFSERPISLLRSFNVSTNLIERRNALNFTDGVTGVLTLPPGVPPRNYRLLLANSKYVLSPPGNGPDCHRTWEAIYLGAIPIVKRNSWPKFEFELPVLIVDEWSEVESIVNSGALPRYSSQDWQLDFWRMVNNG